jgi:hypothetical protein
MMRLGERRSSITEFLAEIVDQRVGVSGHQAPAALRIVGDRHALSQLDHEVGISQIDIDLNILDYA